MKLVAILFVLGLTGCDMGILMGGVGEPCNRDGTCNNANLVCKRIDYGGRYRCHIVMETP